MDLDTILKTIQSAVTETPLIMVGSGASAPHGLPSMHDLGKHLVHQLSACYRGTPCWDNFEANIANDDDLETALTGIELTREVLADIRCETWNLISSRDLAVYEQLLFSPKMLPLSRLLKKFYQAHPRRIDIITTNYDRLIEYACDLAEIPCTVGFDGYYLKHFSGSFADKNSVNLLKVHGSLDVFRDVHGGIVSAPMLSNLPTGLIPEIITPGSSKYAAILHGTHRELLLAADERIKRARSFLCIGYGFNDSQIQEGIITRIRAGIPIVSITQKVSDSAAHLLVNNAQHYITIQQDEIPDKTAVCIDNHIEILDGTFWTIDGFMSLID